MRLGVGRAVQVIYESIGRIGPESGGAGGGARRHADRGGRVLLPGLSGWSVMGTDSSGGRQRGQCTLQPHVSNIIMCAYVCVCVASSCIVEYGKESFLYI